MDVEEAFQVVGEFGAYQKRAVAVLALTQVYMACQSMLVVLVGATPEFHVEKHDGLVSSVTFFGDVDSIVTEWLLVKRQAYKVGLAGSLFFAGLLLGSFVFGPLSDTVGRRPVYRTGGSVLGGAPGLRDGGVSQLRGVRRVAPPGGSDERRHRAGLLHPDAGVRGQVLLGHDRDADQHDVCGGHRPLRSSGFRHPAVEDPGGGGQHLGGPLLLAVRVSARARSTGTVRPSRQCPLSCPQNASGVSSVALLSQPHPAGRGGDAARGADERPTRPQPDAAAGGRRRLGGLPAAGEPSSPPPQDAAAHVCLVCVQSGVLRPDAGRRRHVRKSLPERGHVRPGRAARLPALRLLYEQTLGRPEEKFVGFLMFGRIGVPLHRLRPGGCRVVAGRDGVGAVGKTDGQRGVQHRLRVHVRAVPHRAQERRSGSLRHVLPSRRNSRSVCSFHAGVGHSHAVHRLLFERPLRRRSGAPAAGDTERTAGPDAGRTTSRPQQSSGEQAPVVELFLPYL
ncbi:solute carrier family 22 member 15 isoform X5 [Phycodurus eques]|uniref:solute carrier family 22 member 15 isoform X5 n=1 Tax=Phycodurus eques TaxID=693459 RepID=UPI002ACDE19D|nr:solute carrier family 22 member 15 isoform X5 [Phycodurus eques]